MGSHPEGNLLSIQMQIWPSLTVLVSLPAQALAVTLALPVYSFSPNSAFLSALFDLHCRPAKMIIPNNHKTELVLGCLEISSVNDIRLVLNLTSGKFLGNGQKATTVFVKYCENGFQLSCFILFPSENSVEVGHYSPRCFQNFLASSY